MLSLDAHPLLEVTAFVTEFPKPLGELGTVSAIIDLLKLDAPAPVRSSDGVRNAVSELLRHGGYKPTGRGKPAS
ncbi:MAG: hypothetical protein JST16_15960, partial [Bdellovibrionales bacterium]|nr:hypothetical protein [Bdellovibrionales bacterium]